MVNCSSRNAFRLLALAGVVSMTAAAGATPPSATNVAGNDKPSTGAAAPAVQTKVAPKATTGAKGQATQTKAGAPTATNKAVALPKGANWGGGESVNGVPPNDDCANAIALNIGDTIFADNIGATLDPAAPFCGTSNSVGGVWYTFVGDGSTLPVTTCGAGTTFDSKIYVYTGACDSLVCVAGNDDTCGLQAQVTISTVAGETYRVLVGGFSGQGNFQLTIGAPPPPDCADCPKGAVQEGEGAPCGLDGDFFNGGCNSVPEVYSSIECGQTVCGSGAFDGSLRDTDWYQINISSPTLLTWSCDGADFDWQLFIIDLNAGCAGLSIIGQAAGAACTTGSAQAIAASGTYVMFMAPQFVGTPPCETAYTCSLTCEKAVLPDNDECADAVSLAIPSTTNGSTLGAQPDAADFCGTSVSAGGVWYTVTGTGTTITVSTCNGTDYDSKLNVYCGTGCDDLFCVTGIDDFCGLQSQVSFCSTAGQTYWILVQGFGGAQGNFQLDVSEDGFACEGAAACEPIIIECAKGDVIEGEFESGNGCGIPTDFFNGGCNSVPEVYSTIECGQTVCGSGAFDGFTRDTDWYMVSGLTGPTLLTWTMEESAFDWQLFVIDLTAGCAGLGIIGQAAGNAGTSGSAQAVVGGGGVYALFAGPQFLNTSDCPSGYRASLACEKAVLPENDDCANAQSLAIPSSVSSSTLGAQPDPQAFLCGTSISAGGVWYTVTGTGTTITVSTCNGTDYDNKLNVYCGTGCDDLFCVTGLDDFCGLQSQVSFCSTAGQTYWILVQGFGGAQGNFTLDVSEDGFACEGAAACEPIIVNCQKGDVIEGEFESGNGCGIPTDFYNGGCNSVPEIYSSIECGQTVCGSSAFDPGIGFRDTDWYQITISDATEFTWTMEESSFDWQLFIIDLNGGCAALGIVGQAAGLAGSSGSAVAAVGPGTYVMFAATQFTGSYDCPSGYRASLACGEPCTVTCKGTPEGEDDCGVPADFFNGGCNSVPPVFSTIECGDTICGTGAFDGFTRDTDWYAFTNDTGSDVTLTFTVASDFAWLGGYIEWQPGFEGSGDCAFITGFVNPFIIASGDCTPQSISVTVGQGEHWFFVAPQFAGILNCGPGNRNNYVASLTGDCGGPADCNENGVPDSQDIASGTSDDCFDYSAAAGTRGGPNGIPDECECVADWNRDGTANSTDVSDFINTFFADQVSGGVDGDVNCDGTSNSTDVSDFINVWFAAQAGQLPFAGCSI